MAVTHETDSEQRVLELPYVHDHANPTHVALTAPDGGHPHSLAQQGHYMMFAISNQVSPRSRRGSTCTNHGAVPDNVIAAGGYEAILVFNRTAPDGCSTPLFMDVTGDIPTFGVASREQGFAIFDVAYDEAACVAGDGSQQAPIAIGTVGDTLTFSSYFDGWGYVHLFRNQDGKMAELDTYAIPEAHDPAYASGFGDLSVHEVATSSEDARRLYFSYYSGGFRVARITDDEKITEVGRYIAPAGNNFWGVQVFQDAGKEYVAASDRDSGLWIFRYKP